MYLYVSVEHHHRVASLHENALTNQMFLLASHQQAFKTLIYIRVHFHHRSGMRSLSFASLRRYVTTKYGRKGNFEENYKSRCSMNASSLSFTSFRRQMRFMASSGVVKNSFQNPSDYQLKKICIGCCCEKSARRSS